MKATDIAFVQLVGIKQNENHLSLENKKDIHNHIDTIHACAQVTLAKRSRVCIYNNFFLSWKV
ncbi:MAG TPA: DUF4442 domain-containing protein [Sulfurimonas sp.]|nr:DUF4442 domain-containing protein [Sulfurimonas sp.]